MAWKLTAASPLERLRRKNPNWEKRGLDAWRIEEANRLDRMQMADSGTTLRRAMDSLDEARIAVYLLSKKG